MVALLYGVATLSTKSSVDGCLKASIGEGWAFFLKKILKSVSDLLKHRSGKAEGWLSLNMNYLAHAFLSFNQPEVLTGNMISDFVKGKAQYEFPERIQVGIRLHRVIDHFTDQHAASKVIGEIFRPVYRLYSAAFTDIVYDHFLANDKSLFADRTALELFSKNTYAALDQHNEFFPEKFAAIFPYMHSQDWLSNYRSDTGIERSFQGLGRRARYLEETARAFDLFMKNKALIADQYEIFFPSVKKFASERMQELLKV